MGMNAAGVQPELPSLRRELADYLQLIGSNDSIGQVMETAVRAWIDADKARRPQRHEPTRGYQWKTLFLPDSTELRMACGGTTFHARVDGDEIIFQGRSVSPRGMTLAIAGDGRNAWRDLWLKLPGDRFWKPADRCRREHQLSRSKPAESPVDAMAAAAAAMSDALKAALALVEHTSAQSARKVERRGARHRRESGMLADECSFD